MISGIERHFSSIVDESRPYFFAREQIDIQAGLAEHQV
jgi:hypothetical protein